MGVKRNQRVGIDDRWQKRVRVDGEMATIRSPLWGSTTPRWRVRWVDGDGREHNKSFRVKVDAQAFVNTLTADVVRGDYIDPSKSVTEFHVVAEQFMATKVVRKPKTVAGYRSLLETVIYPRWKTIPLKDITYREYSAWLAELSATGGRSGKGLSASRVTQAHQLVGAVLKYAQKSGLVSKNITASVEPHDLPDEEPREPRFLTAVQLHSLAGHCGDFEAFTLVLGYTGPRFGEAAALKRRNAHDRQFVISESITYVQGKGWVEGTTKTGRVRRVTIPQPIWDMIDLPAQAGAYVFPGKRGHLTVGEYRNIFDKAVKAMQAETNAARDKEITEHGQATTPEFPDITPHDLRHTAASLAISVGANIKVVQNMLGHATASMTLDRYGHLFSDDQIRVADALGDLATAVVLRSDGGR